MKLIKNTQSGRSMVEMLGVLAIIGVLSIGAIAGYSKAMMKYKLNKQSQQLSQLLMTMIEHKSIFSENFSEAEPSLIPYFKKMNLIPKEMLQISELAIYDVFNSKITMYVTPSTNRAYMRLNIDPKNGEAACVNALTVGKEYPSELYALGYNNSTVDVSDEKWYGGFEHDTCKLYKNCMSDLDVNKMYEICASCSETTLSACQIHYIFKF